MKKPKQPSAYYICATIDIFSIQVMLLVGDFDECCKLIEENRSPEYKGPKMSDGLRDVKKKIDDDSTLNIWLTTHQKYHRLSASLPTMYTLRESQVTHAPP